jgi:hypothetical protein
MQSEEKLAEAQYFLNTLRQTPQDNQHAKEYMYVLSAFLSAWRSVIDIILYDYSDKYQLCFSRDEEIRVRDFDVAARSANNTQAQAFIKWYNQQVSKLGQSPLSTKRKIMVHRGYPPTMRVFSVYVSESLAISSSFTINAPPVIPGPNAIPTNTPTQPTPITRPVQTPVTTNAEVRFVDRQDKSVIEYCQEALDVITAIVNDAIQQFGR